MSEKQLRRIWPELKAQPYFERLKSILPAQHWRLSGSRIQGCCPFHDDRTPSFSIYLDRGYAKCYGCDEYFWNPVQLWAKLCNTGFTEALNDLKQMFGLKFLGAGVQAQLKEWDHNQTLKKKIMAVCHDELINAINSPSDPYYAAYQPAVDWLLKERQIPVDAIPSLPMLGVLPPAAVVTSRLADEEAQENARLQEEAEAHGTRAVKSHPYSAEANVYLDGLVAWVGAVVFRMDIAPDAIGRLKLRRAKMPSGDSRYIDDPFAEELGFFGLGWEMYRPLIGGGQQSKYVDGVYTVEGEFDALSTMARQAVAGGPTFVTVSVGGMGQVGNIDLLRHAGFEKAYLVADRPGDKSGEKLIGAWLEKIKQLRSFVFTGYDTFPGHCNDPDSVVVTVGLDAWAKLLLDTSNKNLFQTPPEWAFSRAYPEVDAIPDNDTRGRIEKAAEWGRVLRNNIECDTYVDLIAQEFKLPPSLVKREVVALEEDEPAFIMRLADAYTRVFFPMGQKAQGSDRALMLWHKAKRETVQVSLADDTSIERELGNKLGPAYQFFDDQVGLPAFLQVPELTKEQGKYLQKLDKDLRWYNRQALTIISQGLPDWDMTPHLGQGIHVLPNEDDERAAPTLYLVNGRDVYHGTYGANDALAWTKLDGPSHDGRIFDVGINRIEPSWMTRIHVAADLERARDINPLSLWDRLFPVLDLGWTFKNHQTNAEFLTAHLLATTINNAFKRQVVVNFAADTSAGKSKLNLGLIAGTEVKALHLIEAAVGFQSFSPAGIRMSMDNKVLPLCLDEFEDDGSGDKKAKVVQETLEMIRNLTGETNTITFGSRHGHSKQYNIRTFVFLSAINPARKVQDANRMVVVGLDKKPGRPGPEEVIQQEFGWNYMTELKHDLSIGLLPHVARIQRAYADIEHEFGKPGAKPMNVDQRWFQALFPAMSVMKALGKDYRRWMLQFCEANKMPLTIGVENTDSSQLFNWLTQSGQIIIKGGDRNEPMRVSCLQLLASPELRDQLNLSGSGLFYDEASQLLVVNWFMAIQGVLRGHSRYSREVNVYNLREIANRSPYAVKPEEITRSGALARLKHFGLASVSPTQLTAYRVGHIVSGQDTATQMQTGDSSEASAATRASDDGDFNVA